MGVSASVLRNACTAASTSLNDVLNFSARWLESWIEGPSAIGSENGMPISITSAPAPGSPWNISRKTSGVGSFAVMKATKPARFSAFSFSKRRVMRDFTSAIAFTASLPSPQRP